MSTWGRVLTVWLISFACGRVETSEIDAPPDLCRPSCDDGDACTTDSCDATTGCVHTPIVPTGSQSFAFGGSIQMFMVPACVRTVRITAAGAQGGNSGAQPGGLGAVIAGDFTVTPGEALTILVGGAGIANFDTSGQRGGTGGGGSFVARGQTPLLVAGGGGGAVAGFVTGPGGPGQTTTAGQTGGFGGGAGGTDGGGGITRDPSAGFHEGTGGGGFSGDGVGQSNGDASQGTPNQPGIAFLRGGAGGMGGSLGRNGGFGGGGSAGFTAAGGGGYSGGGNAGNAATGSTHAGGGGGSFNGGMNPTDQAGQRNGNGVVDFAW